MRPSTFSLLSVVWINLLIPAFGDGPHDEMPITRMDVASEDNSGERVEMLARRLLSRARRQLLDSEYYEIREEILAIPGYAEYFGSALRRKQIEVKAIPLGTGERIRYDIIRAECFKVLGLLQTPESLKVLGGFLDDDLDAPGKEWSELLPYRDTPQANSVGAAAAICWMGLQNPPADGRKIASGEEGELLKTRRWWKRVERGDLTFSFEGQVETYRFSSDGSWETILSPNVAGEAHTNPKSAGIAQNDLVDAPNKSRNIKFLWIVGLLSIIGGIGWMLRRKFL
ncbi:hypothetical protein ACFQY0_15055 [Haloferula chungangensis]|uniref:Uncharacterized protein n=1 Tax=Haloferula chungangensis TaxID=1048331 RepID=A0ABW2L820_9BACT